MFKTRLISGIVLMAVLLVCIISGGWAFWGLLLFVSLGGMFELFRLEKAQTSALAFIAYACAVIYALRYALDGTYAADIFSKVPFVLFIAAAVIYVLTYPRYRARQFIMTVFAFFYLPVMTFCMYPLRTAEGGVYLIWLVFIASWGCDTGAYCFGSLLGKHKLAPVLSPHKSIEGAVGGAASSTVLGLALGLIFGSHMTTIASPVVCCALTGLVGSVFSQFGDLTASAIKRNYDIKDYGRLIPGHGGIMDRFDSVIFVSPVIYGMIMLFTVR